MTIEKRRDPQASAGCLSTLSSAFSDDPAFAWLLDGDSMSRERKLLRLFPSAFRGSAKKGMVFTSTDEKAVSLWRDPGSVDPTILELLASAPALAGVFGHRLFDAIRLLNAMHAHQPGGEDFLYLQYVGVHPDAQGQGLGRAVIGAGLEHADGEGLTVVLETAKEANVGLYQRLGFEILSNWRLTPAAPEFWTMVRAPRA